VELPMRATRRVAIFIVSVHAAAHIHSRNTKAVANPLTYAAGAFEAFAKQGQAPAIESKFKVGLALAGLWYQIDNTANCIGPVDRRSRAAQHLYSIEIGRQEIGNERNSRTINVRGIAHA